MPRAGDAPYSLTAVAFLAGAAAAALAGALPFLRTTHSAPPPAAPPLPRPTVAAEVLAHAALLAAERAREGRAGPHDCLLPPSHAPPSREFALPLSDAFGATLNLEALVRPWAPGAAPEQRYGPPPGVVELEAPPSPEAFVRDFVGPGLPFVVRRYAQEHAHWAAMDLWRDDAHLAALVGDIPVDVRRSKHRDAFFHYAHSLSAHARLTMREFLASLSDPAAEQYYLGGQDIVYGRAPGTLRALLPDVEPLLPAFASSVLDLKHVSLWLGRGVIRAPLHYDNSENLLIMVTGEKRFTLIPPGARNFLQPVMLREGNAPLTRMVDIDSVNDTEFPCWRHARAMASTLTVREGDMLYIPPYYWHSVVSSGRSCAVNLWYSPVSALLAQIMKALDHSMLLEIDDDDARPPLTRQGLW